MEKAIAEEVLSFREALTGLGFHPKTVDAYARNLAGFLALNPGAVCADEEESENAINAHLASAAVRHDDFSLRAGLRKWHWLRFGKSIGKKRLLLAGTPVSPQIEEEVARFRRRLESDGLTRAVADAHCSIVTMLLAWRFPDGRVDVSAISEADALAYLTTEKSHLRPGSAKVEASRVKRYLLFLTEGDPGRPRGLPFAPACWGSGSLPRMTGAAELDSILSVETNPEVGSRNRAALLLMANMGLRCCEAAALTLECIDFRNGAVCVPATKGSEARRLPLERDAGEALADYIANHRPISESRAVFLRNKSHRGEPLSLSQMRNSLRYQARLAGIPDFGTHMLRRRAATSMVERGVPLKVVADVLGHVEIQTSKTYLRVDVEGLRTVASDWPGDRRG